MAVKRACSQLRVPVPTNLASEYGAVSMKHIPPAHDAGAGIWLNSQSLPCAENWLGKAPDLCFECDDTDAFQAQAAVSGWDIRYTQLERGRFAGSYEIWSCPNLAITREHYRRRVNVVGTAPPARTSVIIPIRPSGAIRFKGTPLCPGSLIVLAPGQLLDFTTLGAADFISVQIAHSFFEDAARDIFGDGAADRLFYGKVLSPSDSRLAGLRTLLPTPTRHGHSLLEFYDSRTARAYLAGMVAGRLLVALVDDADRNNSGGVNAAERFHLVAARARDFIEANADRSVSREELCAASGAKLRRLHYSFKTCYGISPVAYGWCRRLKLARDQLKEGHPRQLSVTDVATGQGFWHFGRFARDYKAVFGESPSTTLSRPRNEMRVLHQIIGKRSGQINRRAQSPKTNNDQITAGTTPLYGRAAHAVTR